MPTRAEIIPYLSRKDRVPQKQYPIGGTYLSIPYMGVSTSPWGFLGCTKYNLKGAWTKCAEQFSLVVYFFPNVRNVLYKCQEMKNEKIVSQ